MPIFYQFYPAVLDKKNIAQAIETQDSNVIFHIDIFPE